MIDLHTHTLLSDGALVPSELIQRARVAGYTALAITDHADESNIDAVITQAVKVCARLNRARGFSVVPGVELTHIPPADIPMMVRKARSLGALIVVGHGETLAEPVEPGTNEAYIRSRVDILAHPGLLTPALARLASLNSVHLEITVRRGHCLSNGHVAAAALKSGARLVINTDAHAPGDLVSDGFALRAAIGAGLDKNVFRRMQANAKAIVGRALGRAS
jgi:histidinol phosphatase-like PHP family hydrolase